VAWRYEFDTVSHGDPDMARDFIGHGDDGLMLAAPGDELFAPLAERVMVFIQPAHDGACSVNEQGA